MDKQALIDLVKTALPDAVVITEGEDCSFSIQVISDSFTGQRTVTRQQKVLSLFNNWLRTGELHALTVKAFTQEEWQQERAKQQPIQIQW